MRLLAVTISTLLCLALLEVGFRIAGYEPLAAVYSKPELFWQHDPLLGWSLEPGAQGEYVGPRPFPITFRAPVRVNSLGLRGPEVRPVPDGGSRVLLLGDSQAAAFEVPEQETYAARTAAMLGATLQRPVDVVNGGVRGYGTDQTYLLYTTRLRDLRPDVVVFHASANDPEDDTTLHRMRRPFGKPAYALAEDGTIGLVGAPVPAYPLCSLYRLDETFTVRRLDGARSRAMCWVQARLADHSAFLSFLLVRLQRNPRLIWQLNRLGTPEGQAAHVPPAAPEPAPPAPPIATGTPGTPQPPDPATLGHAQRLTSRLILELVAAARRDGAAFVLLANAADLAQLDLGAFTAEDIDIVVVDDVLGADQTAFRFANDGHLNPEGHRRLADLLAGRLAEVLRR